MMLDTIFTSKTIGISEFKAKPTKAIEEAGDEAIAVLSNNQTSFYCLSKARYEEIMEILEDIQLAKIVKERLSDDEELIEADF